MQGEVTRQKEEKELEGMTLAFLRDTREGQSGWGGVVSNVSEWGHTVQGMDRSLISSCDSLC